MLLKVYEWLNNISPPFAWGCFKQKNNSHNLSNAQLLELSKCRTKTYGLHKALYKRVLFCGINHFKPLQNHFNEAKSYIQFKNLGMDREVMCLLFLLLSCFLVKNR